MSSDPPQTSKSHYTTPTIRILSNDNQSFTVHSGLLGSKSTSLRALVSGDWKEGSEGEIDWSTDWDSDTISLFLDWVYTGDYEAPYPTLAAGTGTNDATPATEDSTPKKQKKKGKKQIEQQAPTGSGFFLVRRAIRLPVRLVRHPVRLVRLAVRLVRHPVRLVRHPVHLVRRLVRLVRRPVRLVVRCPLRTVPYHAP